MENEAKVFHSDITRVDCKEENHLYDLLKIEPAEPIPQRSHKHRNMTWEFTPNYDKRYIPQKGSKLKVKTVGDVRTIFERDIYSYLSNDLENQQNNLLRKIQDGSSNDEKTKNTARNMLNADNPISKSAWQMLANINPEGHYHSKQFVLWAGKCIQVNGSRGGKSKFICNYDLESKKVQLKNTYNFKKKMFKSRIGLLRNSLNVKFKPGPLGKKKFLDDSHHKYQMNHIELIKLPTPALQVSPAYGTVLEPTIVSFINNLRGDTGVISHKFADFAVSVLGIIRDKTPAQLDKECCITFDLNYQCDQNRLLMRRNAVNTTSYINDENNSITIINDSKTISTNIEINSNPKDNLRNHSSTILEVKQVMDEMLNSVEISLNQDSMYTTDDESREIMVDNCSEIIDTTKDKPKRKYLELGKLDVTVIKLPESSQKDSTKPCSKSFCNFGCICDSLDSVFSLKQHCGVLDCMFGCKCEVSKYKHIELLDRDCSDIIPGLLNLDNEINSNLAKEEQKFHQTVIVSGEKSIVLKSSKRNCNSSLKNAEFHSNMKMKTDEIIKRILTVNVNKLNCENIEPFCIVHNLYKCFCKGKFTESSIMNMVVHVPEINATVTETLTNVHENLKHEHEITSDKTSNVKTALRPRLRIERKSCGKNRTVSASESHNIVNLCLNAYDNIDDDCCARTICYTGRKYTDGYYKNTNNKISEMEKNDQLLKKKMIRLINGANEDDSQSRDTTKNSIESLNSDEALNKQLNKSGEFNYPFSNIAGKSSLKDWLEFSYKTYKERLGQGTIKNCLDAPKKGKASLQSWDFILSRYRERKNLFLVSKHEPFRTFLAVDEKHPFFANCINIDDIRFADLHTYPLIIRNLVTNATDSENSFCILRGWDHCWELIGSAVKVIERVAENQPESNESLETDKLMTQNSLDNEDDDDWTNEGSLLSQLLSRDNSLPLEDDKKCNELEGDNLQSLERSKWFVMTVENDFTEIQFYKRGFYVTYDGIQRSICLARISGKTVRLSSQARTDKNNTHQFGIYAIPCISECCVFIGPYEVNEPLGIEIVKTSLDPRKQSKTRGVWITTNKVDNMKVIEHPLEFMPSVSIPSEAMVTLETGSTTNTNQSLTRNENNKHSEELPNLHKNTSEGDTVKSIKPIKIRRTNGFYHLSSNNILQKIPPIKASNLFIQKPTTSKKNTMLISNSVSLINTDDTMLKNKSEKSISIIPMANVKPISGIAPKVNNSDEPNQNISTAYIRPVAEIAPQIKITSVYSERNMLPETDISEKSKGMLILNPEEINKKLLGKTTTNDDMSTDIEKFIETSTICIAPHDEIFVISDIEDEEDTISGKNVWIQCWNVDNFGCIRGKVNDDKLLSFEFPGFKYTDFYTESEAFDKINQVLSRKMYIPKNIKLQWQVIENEDHLNSKMLTPECFVKNYLLVKLQEHRYKKKRLLKKAAPIRTYSRINKLETESSSKASFCVRKDEISETKNETNELLKCLDKTSTELENQSTLLWNEAVTKRNEIMNSLTVPDNLKATMSDTLQDIMIMNE